MVWVPSTDRVTLYSNDWDTQSLQEKVLNTLVRLEEHAVKRA